MRTTPAVVVFLLLLAVVGISSSRQVVADTRIVQFPREPPIDSWSLSYYPYWSAVGDSVTGTREIDITKINRAEIHLGLEENTASPSNPHIFEVSLNGEVVGTFNVSRNDGYKKDASISFAPLDTQGLVTIQYKLIKRTAGTFIIIANGSSTLSLSDGLAPETKKDFALQALGKLEELHDHVSQSDIDQGPKRSLLGKLDRAIAKVNEALVYIDKGYEQKANNKLRIAKNSVLSFVKGVENFSERIASGDSEHWKSDAEIIIGLIERAIETPI